MATGYTHPVRTGEIADFPTFAMQCARAFGACITMRDDPVDAEIPDEFKPSSYHSETLDTAHIRRLELEQMSDEDKTREATQAYQNALNYWTEREAERREEIARYETMLASVKAWTPPTPDHDGLRKFMIEQLEESIRFDNHSSNKPVEQSAEDWHRAELENTLDHIKYHEREHRNEVKRAKDHTEWVRALRQSLAGPDAERKIPDALGKYIVKEKVAEDGP